MSLTELSCNDFTVELSSKKPVPGGGGAAAFTGSLGVALNMMVANFSKGKKKFIQFEKQHEEILDKGEKLRIELLNLVEKDAINFEPLSKAYTMPSATEEEKAAKEKEMQKCLKTACSAPIEMMERIFEAINLHEELADIASANIISDIGVGVSLLKAALNSAYVNVLINANLIHDDEYVHDIKNGCRSLLIIGNEKADKIYDKVLKIIL